jgi:hypothetical protein
MICDPDIRRLRCGLSGQTAIPSKGTFRFSAQGTDLLWGTPRGLIPRGYSILVRESMLCPRYSVYDE